MNIEGLNVIVRNAHGEDYNRLFLAYVDQRLCDAALANRYWEHKALLCVRSQILEDMKPHAELAEVSD